MKRTSPKQYEHLSLRLGQMIRRERERLGLTQGQLAELAGGSQMWVWGVENGTRKKFYINCVFALVEAMGLNVGDFFSELFDENNENKEAKK